MVDDVSRRLTTSGSLENRRRTGALTAENRHDTRASRRVFTGGRAPTRARLSPVANAFPMPPADAPDARPHEIALAEDLTGASLLRTRNVDNTEKRVEKAETRSETRSAAARPWSAPDAQEPPPARMRAKHASTRRPGAILRAAERLARLAAAVEDAAVSDAIENDGSLDQPPGGSDDTRIEEQVMAAFREPDVFDALFLREKEKETDGETNLRGGRERCPSTFPAASLSSTSTSRVYRTSRRKTRRSTDAWRRRRAPIRETRKRLARRGRKKEKKKKAAARAFSETNEDTNDPSMPLDADLARAFARALRVAVDGAKAKARAARERLTNRLKNLINDDARASAALRGVALDPWLAEEALATRADAHTHAHTHTHAGARTTRGATHPTRRLAAGPRLAVPSARVPRNRRAPRAAVRARERAGEVQRAVAADAASARLPGGALRPPVPLGRAARAPGARVGHVARAGGELVHQRARAHLAADRSSSSASKSRTSRGRTRATTTRGGRVNGSRTIKKTNQPCRSGTRGAATEKTKMA